MSPFQHGEVYVTDDGAETDLDLVIMRGFQVFLQKNQTISQQSIYNDVLKMERQGKY